MLYNTARRVLFAMNPEMAHSVTMANLDWIVHMGLHKLVSYVPDDDPVTVMGVRFPNAIGLAAGMDKDGTRVSAFGGLGFGHVEVGTITPLAQPGNPKPRLFRLIPAGGIINRMGFNNQGVEQVLKNLRSADGFRLRGGVLGINIGKNAVTPIENALSDYEKCLDAVYDHADYIAVNISSPNTKNLRTLQGEEELEKLVAGICARREALKEARHGKHVPIAVKLAPDLENDDILRCVDTLMLHGIDGVIATNTTISRKKVEGLKHAEETGGLSGAPLRERSTEVRQGRTSHHRFGRRHVRGRRGRKDGGGCEPRSALHGLHLRRTQARRRQRDGRRQVAPRTRLISRFLSLTDTPRSSGTRSVEFSLSRL